MAGDLLPPPIPPGACRPVLAENSPLDCFPGARTPFDRFHLRLKALAVKSARKRFPFWSTGSLPWKSPRCRRACRRQRLKVGALPSPTLPANQSGSHFDHLRFCSTMVADLQREAACRHKSSKNGSRWRTRFAESTVASRPKADRQSKGLSPLPQRGPSAVFPVTISGPPRSGVTRFAGGRGASAKIGL